MAIKIVGRNTIIEALKANKQIFELYVQNNTNQDIVAEAKRQKIKITMHDKHALKDILPHHHQGVGALVKDYTYMPLDQALAKKTPNKVFLMLDNLTDPHNLGAILRSVDAFSIDAVIIPKHRSVDLNATVAKVSTGAIEYVDVIKVTNLNNTIRKLKENGFWIAGTDIAAEKDLTEIDVNTNLCVVIGSEGDGLRRMVKENCDYLVKIPMTGHVNSLNASVSAGIVLYEIFKKKQ